MRSVETMYARLGAELRRRRRQKGLTQVELARRVDPESTRIGRSSIANIEGGKQRVALHLFLALAEALDVDPAELLPREPKEVPGVADRVRDLPQREQEWLMTVLTPKKRRPRRRAAAT
jgi:transcriptional regulator with XRE-family HTH domain